MNDPGGTYRYPEPVRIKLRDDVVEDYLKAAKFLNRSGFDLVSLQHEYGIFGGVSGSHIVELLSRLDMPIVTTLHTVLSDPNPDQRDVMSRIIERSSKLVVMSEKGREVLYTSHGVPAHDIDVIAHGIPDFPFLEPTGAKQKLGFDGRTVILTFGLLSPSKSIETVIDAMPEIIRSCPTAVYVVLGARILICCVIKVKSIATVWSRAYGLSASTSTSCSSISSSTNRRCWTSSRCAMSTLRRISMKRR